MTRFVSLPILEMFQLPQKNFNQKITLHFLKQLPLFTNLLSLDIPVKLFTFTYKVLMKVLTFLNFIMQQVSSETKCDAPRHYPLNSSCFGHDFEHFGCIFELNEASATSIDNANVEASCGGIFGRSNYKHGSTFTLSLSLDQQLNRKIGCQTKAFH
ncbi:hypothetical protein P3S68_007695 [Capsicum galapagoense]